ncbi:MAG: hypothetical protein ABR588_05910 [Sphingomicrobium sp.]|nr:hypothetical protein [Sphingomonadales bacterium]
MATQQHTRAHLRAPLAILIAALIGTLPIAVCILASNSVFSAEVAR